MCPECYNELDFGDFSANRIIDGVNIFCAGVYKKELQMLIRGLKYHGQKDLAYYQAKFMYDFFINVDSLNGKDFEIVPVPLHSSRIKKRKYNHMELVCKEFEKISGLKCNFDLIKRVKDTKPQYKLSRNERLVNLSDAFEVNISAFNNKPILILDDICTTGATFEEMIKCLKQHNINDITCFATSTPI